MNGIASGFSAASANSDQASGLAFDARNLSNLKNSARDNSPEAIRGVAKQIESIFLNMMLKSMRDASPQDGSMNNEQIRQFTSMLDQQLSQTIAGKGIGLADVLVRQLSQSKATKVGTVDDQQVNRADGTTADGLEQEGTAEIQSKRQAYTNLNSGVDLNSRSITRMNHAAMKQYSDVDRGSNWSPNQDESKRDQMLEFNARMRSAAEKVSKTSGVPAVYIMAQAALESGWGRHEIKHANGMTSHNLFGIKASGDWTGKTVDAMTTEYIDGEKVTRVEKFRAYNSYAESFSDFIRLLKSNSRYQQVLNNVNDPVSYTQAMQRSGYATDPAYGKKLLSVILNFMVPYR